MNFRIEAASSILESVKYKSILDVGCRRCDLKNVLTEGKEYYGCDLFQHEGLVEYVGDVMSIEFNRKFDSVIALDIVEHVDNCHELMDKLFSLSNKYIIISLPNIYDIQHKYHFIRYNTLGGKYIFNTANSLDRHRWVMNYDEIYNFYTFYADKHNCKLTFKDIKLGSNSSNIFSKIITKILNTLGFYKSTTRAVLGVFEKK
jgi:hypothetical protein